MAALLEFIQQLFTKLQPYVLESMQNSTLNASKTLLVMEALVSTSVSAISAMFRQLPLTLLPRLTCVWDQDNQRQQQSRPRVANTLQAVIRAPTALLHTRRLMETLSLQIPL